MWGCTPKLFESSMASFTSSLGVTLWSGITRVFTLSEPKAFTAKVKDSAESTPPLNPTTTPLAPASSTLDFMKPVILSIDLLHSLSTRYFITSSTLANSTTVTASYK